MYLSTNHTPSYVEIRPNPAPGLAGKYDDMALRLIIGTGATLYLGEREAEQLAADLLAAVAARRGEVVPSP